MTIAKSCSVAAVAYLALAAVAPAPARAQSAGAEVLFREGRALLKQGKITEACDKFAASERIESSPGTLLNLADCREKNHQLATAWTTFGKAATAARLAGDAKREAEAHRREKLLESRLAKLTIAVPPASRVAGLAITRDGLAIDPALWGQPVPVDTGSYDVVAQAPGHDRWSQHVAVGSDGATVRVEVPALATTRPSVEPATTTSRPAPTEPAPPGPTAAPAPSPAPAPAPARDAGPGAFTGMRDAAIVVGVIGLGGIAAGAVFGSKANDLERRSDALCPTDTCDDPIALRDNHDARSDASTSTVAFIAGGAAVAGAVVLWFVGAPKQARDEVAVMPVVSPRSVGLSIGGSF